MTRAVTAAGDGSWSIGLVEVDRDAPLPDHPGRHRLLTVVEGTVLDLRVDGEPHVVEPRRPFAVPGDATTAASAPEGPVQVLEVVVDPARVRAYVTVLELGRSSRLPVAGDQAAYVVAGDRDGLATGALVRGPGEVAGRCTVAVVTLERVV